MVHFIAGIILSLCAVIATCIQSERSISYRAWLKKTNFHKDTVVVTLLNAFWLDRLGEFVISVTNLTNVGVHVVALDEKTVTECIRLKLPYSTIVLNGIYREQSEEIKIKELVMRGKFEAIHDFIKDDFITLFMEMDIFFNQKRNILKFLNQMQITGKHDAIFSQHNYHPELNIGVFIVYPTKRSNALFHRVLTWVNQPTRAFADACGTMDQKLVDYAVRGVGQLDTACRFPPAQLEILYHHNVTEPIRFEYISYNVVPHPSVYVDPISGLNLLLHNISEYYAMHLWSGAPKETRIEFARRNGYWSEALPLASDALIPSENVTYCEKALIKLGYSHHYHRLSPSNM